VQLDSVLWFNSARGFGLWDAGKADEPAKWDGAQSQHNQAYYQHRFKEKQALSP
jgi:hypothetical protein